MSLSNNQRRRIVGLSLVVLVYVAGLIGWSWAVLTIDSAPAGGERQTTEVHNGASQQTVEGTRWVQPVKISQPTGEKHVRQ